MAYVCHNTIFTLHFSFLLIIPSLSDVPPSTPVTLTTACNATTDPSFCHSVLLPLGSQNLYTYTRFSLAKSLTNANKFLSIIGPYLSRHSSLSQTAIQALEDCQLLAGLNIDFLSASGTINNSTSNLADPQTDQLHTLISALLTNQQTCVDGIDAAVFAWSVKHGIYVPLSNGTKLYSVSLSLFTRAWVKKKPKTNPKGRKLLQLSMSSVLVSDVVFVSQDGTGNFSTVSDAVASAPNTTDGSKVYFVIHVTAGVYQYYVTISKNKKHVMMDGEGINRTVNTSG